MSKGMDLSRDDFGALQNLHILCLLPRGLILSGAFSVGMIF